MSPPKTKMVPHHPMDEVRTLVLIARDRPLLEEEAGELLGVINGLWDRVQELKKYEYHDDHA